MKRIAVAAVIALVAVACSDSDPGAVDGNGRTTSVEEVPTTAAPGETTTTTAAAPTVEHLARGASRFHEVPVPLPVGDHGDLIRVQPADGAPEGTTWQRIMYLSESVEGEPIAVTGVVTLPDGEPPAGGWPLIAHAHGTTGIADACAPSVNLTSGGPYAMEIMLLAPSVASGGFALVSTDYEGLGVEGRHPYLVGESAGRSVLDSLLAARQLGEVISAAPVGIVGYSQGGHAAAWAGQLAPQWAPGLDIVGLLAGAPASEVPEFVAMDAGNTRPLLQAREVIVASGLAATSAEFDLDAALSDEGLAVLGQLDERCEPDLNPGEPLTRVDLTAAQPWAGALAANVPGTTQGATSGAAPVLIVHSRADTVVPIEHGEALAARLCDAGRSVEMRELPEGEHAAAGVTAYRLGLAWIMDLMGGATAVSTCA